MLKIESNLRLAATLRDTGIGCLMEVGHSVDVHHNLGIILSKNVTLFWNKHTMGSALLVHNQMSPSIYLGLYFPSLYFQNKAI